MRIFCENIKKLKTQKLDKHGFILGYHNFSETTGTRWCKKKKINKNLIKDH